MKTNSENWQDQVKKRKKKALEKKFCKSTKSGLQYSEGTLYWTLISVFFISCSSTSSQSSAGLTSSFISNLDFTANNVSSSTYEQKLWDSQTPGRCCWRRSLALWRSSPVWVEGSLHTARAYTWSSSTSPCLSASRTFDLQSGGSGSPYRSTWRTSAMIQQQRQEMLLRTAATAVAYKTQSAETFSLLLFFGFQTHQWIFL